MLKLIPPAAARVGHDLSVRIAGGPHGTQRRQSFHTFVIGTFSGFVHALAGLYRTHDRVGQGQAHAGLLEALLLLLRTEVARFEDIDLGRVDRHIAIGHVHIAAHLTVFAAGADQHVAVGCADVARGRRSLLTTVFIGLLLGTNGDGNGAPLNIPLVFTSFMCFVKLLGELAIP